MSESSPLCSTTFQNSESDTADSPELEEVCMTPPLAEARRLTDTRSSLEAGAKPAGMVGTFEETVKFWRGLPPTNTDALLDIPLRDGRVSKARVYTSPASQPHTGPRALIVYLRLGAGRAGAHRAHRKIARGGDAPTYRLSHQAPFPAAPDDVLDALKWLSQPANASTLGADVSAGFILGGVSAGGDLAAVTAQRYVCAADGRRAARAVPARGAARPAGPARTVAQPRAERRRAQVIDAAAMDFLLAEYKPDIASPFNAPRACRRCSSRSRARTRCATTGWCTRENGVQTRLNVYPGVPHIHNFAFLTLKSAYRAHFDLILGVGWLLGKEIGDDEAGRAFRTARALVSAL